MKIAMFVTGAVRTLQLDCTLSRSLHNIAVPLSADFYYSINVPAKTQLRMVREYVENVTHGLHVMYKDVYIDTGHYNESRNCHHSIGRAQAEGMVRCMRALQTSQIHYQYVIRTRTDLYVPFVLRSLPSPLSNVAYVGFVGGRCNDKRAWWVDDRFAILPTAAVQKAYLLGYAEEVCNQVCIDRSCYAPECKLGNTLAKRGVLPIDLRDVHTTSDLQIIRSDCLRETSGKHWIRPSSLPPFAIAAEDLSTLRPKRSPQSPLHSQPQSTHNINIPALTL